MASKLVISVASGRSSPLEPFRLAQPNSLDSCNKNLPSFGILQIYAFASLSSAAGVCSAPVISPLMSLLFPVLLTRPPRFLFSFPDLGLGALSFSCYLQARDLEGTQTRN